MRKVLKWLLISLAGIILILYATDYNYILKGIRVVYLTGHTTAFIDDYTYFDNRSIETKTIQEWPQANSYNSIKPTKRLDSVNNALGTTAFLIIKNGEIIYENYAPEYSKDSKTNSFSMAKSITTSLLFKAIQDGYIKSLEQPITDFFPNFKGQFAQSTSVGDLASMASGLNWEEDYYSPFSMTARAYYDDHIGELIESLEVNQASGQKFEYLSGNTLLLGMIISKATNKSLSEYLSQSFWRPLGMRQTAYWQLDNVESGIEKAYCCIASNARDFAKFGQLYLQNGYWNGKQILDTAYVKLATKARFNESPQYGYGFWLSDYKAKQIFSMRGILGQYVISIPEDNMVIVRLGHQRSLVKRNHFPTDFYIYIDEAYQMLKS